MKTLSFVVMFVFTLVKSAHAQDARSAVESVTIEHPQMSVHDNTLRHIEDKKHVVEPKATAKVTAINQTEGDRAARFLTEKIKTQPNSELAKAFKGKQAAQGLKQKAEADARWKRAVSDSLNEMK